MAGRKRELRTLMEDTLKKCGVEDYEFGVAPNGHQQVVFTVADQTRKFCFSKSPSKSTQHVAVQQLKRVVRSCRRRKSAGTVSSGRPCTTTRS